jgi:hypothetical protein
MRPASEILQNLTPDTALADAWIEKMTPKLEQALFDALKHTHEPKASLVTDFSYEFPNMPTKKRASCQAIVVEKLKILGYKIKFDQE